MNREFLFDLDYYIKMKRYRLINAIAVYEKGELVFERYYNKYNEDSRHNLKSILKSIWAITLGICIDKGLVKSVDEPIFHYLPEFDGSIQPHHQFITVKHLLTMSSGIYFNPGIHYHCPMLDQMLRSKNWISHIADAAMCALPGTRFQYKEWDVILLSALMGKACGGTAWDICSEYIYKPLQIKSDIWKLGRPGINYGAGEDNAGLSARDLAKIGLLFLNNGIWQDEQIINPGYVKAAVSPSEANSGYGYLWWLSEKGYHGRGFGGQELNVYPAEDIVAVVQATATPSSKSYGDICENIINK